LIGHVGGNGIGFTGASVQEMASEEEIERGIASDEDDGDPGSWTVVDPAEALETIQVEMNRAREAIWSRDYADHFKLVSAEYDLLLGAINGPDTVRKYERFRDPL
jgi:hypothetical protein